MGRKHLDNMAIYITEVAQTLDDGELYNIDSGGSSLIFDLNGYINYEFRKQVELEGTRHYVKKPFYSSEYMAAKKLSEVYEKQVKSQNHGAINHTDILGISLSVIRNEHEVLLSENLSVKERLDIMYIENLHKNTYLSPIAEGSAFLATNLLDLIPSPYGTVIIKNFIKDKLEDYLYTPVLISKDSLEKYEINLLDNSQSICENFFMFDNDVKTTVLSNLSLNTQINKLSVESIENKINDIKKQQSNLSSGMSFLNQKINKQEKLLTSLQNTVHEQNKILKIHAEKLRSILRETSKISEQLRSMDEQRKKDIADKEARETFDSILNFLNYTNMLATRYDCPNLALIAKKGMNICKITYSVCQLVGALGVSQVTGFAAIGVALTCVTQVASLFLDDDKQESPEEQRFNILQDHLIEIRKDTYEIRKKLFDFELKVEFNFDRLFSVLERIEVNQRQYFSDQYLRNQRDIEVSLKIIKNKSISYNEKIVRMIQLGELIASVQSFPALCNKDIQLIFDNVNIDVNFSCFINCLKFAEKKFLGTNQLNNSLISHLYNTSLLVSTFSKLILIIYNSDTASNAFHASDIYEQISSLINISLKSFEYINSKIELLTDAFLKAYNNNYQSLIYIVASKQVKEINQLGFINNNERQLLTEENKSNSSFIPTTDIIDNMETIKKILLGISKNFALQPKKLELIHEISNENIVDRVISKTQSNYVSDTVTRTIEFKSNKDRIFSEIQAAINEAGRKIIEHRLGSDSKPKINLSLIHNINIVDKNIEIPKLYNDFFHCWIFSGLISKSLYSSYHKVLNESVKSERISRSSTMRAIRMNVSNQFFYSLLLVCLSSRKFESNYELIFKYNPQLDIITSVKEEFLCEELLTYRASRDSEIRCDIIRIMFLDLLVESSNNQSPLSYNKLKNAYQEVLYFERNGCLNNNLEQKDFLDAMAWIAVSLGNERLLKDLKNKFNHNSKMLKSNFSIIMLATFMGNVNIVKILLDSSVNVNTKISLSSFTFDHFMPDLSITPRIHRGALKIKPKKVILESLIHNQSVLNEIINQREVSVSALTKKDEIIQVFQNYDEQQSRIGNRLRVDNDEEKLDIPSNVENNKNKIDVLKNLFTTFNEQFKFIRDSRESNINAQNPPSGLRRDAQNDEVKEYKEEKEEKEEKNGYVPPSRRNNRIPRNR